MGISKSWKYFRRHMYYCLVCFIFHLSADHEVSGCKYIPFLRRQGKLKSLENVVLNFHKLSFCARKRKHLQIKTTNFYRMSWHIL